MAAARLSAMLSLLLLVACSHRMVNAGDGDCREDILGQSSVIGSKQKGAVMVDHTSLSAKGPISRVSLYYSKGRGCLKGAKAAFGSPPVPGMVGSSADATEKSLKLEAGEVITKAEYKAGKCIEFIRLSTNKGRQVSVGRVGGDLTSSAPADGKGQLLAIKGGSKPKQGNKPGALQHLQLVWGTAKCSGASTSAEVLVAESGSLSSEAAAGPGACKPRTDMCNEKASMNAFTYCVWNEPFSAPSCRGGCCVSSGKCASSSCAISGMGRDVPNMICYGVNQGVGFGGNSNCAGLGCKLANAGCTTDAFGGNCVGTVVTTGSNEAVHPESAKFIGAPCLDATPSDTTVDAAGNPASGEAGVYMGKLWTICDCSEGGIGLPEAQARLLNLTTSRISNFTKNEVMAAFSTLLPQKNLTDDEAPGGKAKVVTLLPSFADMFKLPSLSSINLPSILGNLTGAKAGKDGGSVAGPKLPDLSGLLLSLKPAAAPAAADSGASVLATTSAATSPTLNFESGSMPSNGSTVAELMMVPESSGTPPVAAPQQKPAPRPRTLGALLSRFTKPKEESNGDGSSTFTPGTTDADKSALPAASATKAKPMTLGSLLGWKAGPDSSNGTAGATATTAPGAGAGNSTRKLDLSPIGALISKFINGPQAAAAPATATTTAAPAAPAATTSAAQPASAPAALQSTPAAAPAAPAAAKPPAAAAAPPPRPAGPAVLVAPAKGALHVQPPTPVLVPEQAAVPPSPPAEAGEAPKNNGIAGDPNNRPLTLVERIRLKKQQEQLAASQGGNSSSNATAAAPAAAAPSQPAEAAPAAPQRSARRGFSANVNLPPADPVLAATGMDGLSLLYNLQDLTEALRARGTAAANPEDIMAFSNLLTLLQQVPGGLGALPPVLSAALMTLAEEVNKANAGVAAAPAPAADSKDQQQPAAAAKASLSSVAPADAAEAGPDTSSPKEKPASSQQQPSTAGAAKQEQKPEAASSAPAKAAGQGSGSSSQPQPAPAAVPPSTQPQPAAAVKQPAQQPAPAAAAAAAAAPPAAAAAASKQPAAQQPAAAAVQASKPSSAPAAAPAVAAAQPTH